MSRRGGNQTLRLRASRLLKGMSDEPVVIDWWRLLIYVCFCLAVAAISNAILERLLASHDWLVEQDQRGRSVTWLIAFGLSLLAGKLLNRVLPLVPGQK